MSPETKRKRTRVRAHLKATGYERIDTNIYQSTVDGSQINLDAAEMRDGRLRPLWAWIYDGLGV